MPWTLSAGARHQCWGAWRVDPCSGWRRRREGVPVLVCCVCVAWLMRWRRRREWDLKCWCWVREEACLWHRLEGRKWHQRLRQQGCEAMHLPVAVVKGLVCWCRGGMVVVFRAREGADF